MPLAMAVRLRSPIGEGDDMFWHDSQSELGVSQNGSYPALGTFDDFALKSRTARGVMIDGLDIGTVLTVGTKHSCYRFVIVDPSARLARVTGGSLFDESTDVRIDGATLGGSMIKAGWVGEGLRLEFTAGGRRITTSRVRFLSVDSSPHAASVA